MARRVVFDCNIFAQALISPKGPAGRCFRAAADGRVELFLSDQVLAEVRELPTKLPSRLRVTPDRVEWLILEALKRAVLVEVISEVFTHPRDPDDAHYINLALAADASVVVSRDNDLLDLMRDGPDGIAFRARFPKLQILDPISFLDHLDRSADEP